MCHPRIDRKGLGREFHKKGSTKMAHPQNAFLTMDRQDLLRAVEMFAKNWLAHDGSWFLAAEECYGMEAAIDLDARSWKRFAAAEARRIMDTFHIGAEGGLEALERALGLRLYAVINSQRTEWSEDRKRLRFFMDACRVQEARHRKGLPDFPCKSVGTVEFETFAGTIDPRIRTTCLHCPPDATSGQNCAWEFTID
jgi:hypothetical protein